MPRTRAQTASTYSNGDSDPEMDLIHHQMRIVELRKERDERLNTIVAESKDALDDLRSRIEAHCEKQRQQSVKGQGKHIMTIIEKLERRREIEEQMVEYVTEMHTQMRKVEVVMLAGYHGREEEAISLKNNARLTLPTPCDAPRKSLEQKFGRK